MKCQITSIYLTGLVTTKSHHEFIRQMIVNCIFERIWFCVYIYSDAVQIDEMDETSYAQNMRISINTTERHLIYLRSNVKFTYLMEKLRLFTNLLGSQSIIIIIIIRGTVYCSQSKPSLFDHCKFCTEMAFFAPICKPLFI